MTGIDVLRIHHVAIADGQQGKVRKSLTSLLNLTTGHHEAADGFEEHLLPIGDSCLQTIEVNGPGTVQRFIDRRGPGLHHVAFEVTDLAAALNQLNQLGARLIDETPRAGGAGTMIAFVHPESFGGILVELVEVSHA